MARTRAQAQAAASEEQPDQKQTKPSSKATAKKDSKTRKPAKSLPGKRAHEDEQNDPKNETKPEAKPKASKKSKPSDTAQSQQEPSTLNSTLSALLSKYGQVPLQEAKLPDPSRPLPDTLLAFVFNAMLTSARISHELAARSVSCLIDAGYHDIHTLKNSSWEERTEALTKGGYTHYREKTATMLGELADLVLEKYDGDLNNLLKQTESSPSKIRAALKEIKGIGEVGLDIFCDSAQGVWPCLAPFIDLRSQQTVKQLGLGSVEKLWQEVGEDPMQMCKLASALTTVRLEKKVDEFTK